MNKKVSYLIIGIFVLIWILPLFRMIQISFEGEGLTNYKIAIESEGFFRFFLNSFYVTFIQLLISTVCVVMAAFAFSKMHFPGKTLLFLLCIMGMMIPPASLIVPIFLQTKSLGLINNTSGVIGPQIALSLPFGILIVKSLFDEIPDQILEAASIDGASRMRQLLSVIVPLGKPAIATVAIFNFLSSWKDFLFPFIMLNDYDKMVVSLLPQKFMDSLGMTSTQVLYAVLVLSSIPIFIVYLIGEKKIEEGLTAGAIK